MSNFMVVVSSTVDELNTEYGFDTLVGADEKQAALLAGFVADGWEVDAFDNECLWRGSNILTVDVETEVDEENDSPWSEYERGWANIRADERAAVERQNREDVEYARQQASVPYYQGVRGSRDGDGGYIFEP